jgi:hypothetical protein
MRRKVALPKYQSKLIRVLLEIADWRTGSTVGEVWLTDVVRLSHNGRGPFDSITVRFAGNRSGRRYALSVFNTTDYSVDAEGNEVLPIVVDADPETPEDDENRAFACAAAKHNPQLRALLKEVGL